MNWLAFWQAWGLIGAAVVAMALFFGWLMVCFRLSDGAIWGLGLCLAPFLFALPIFVGLIS